MTLKELLKKKGITAYELSKQSGYPISCCYRLTTGERLVDNISMKTLIKLANVLTDGDTTELLKLLNNDVK